MNDLSCKNISWTDAEITSLHRSENPGSPSLLPRLEVTLLLRLDLSESVRLLCVEAVGAAAPVCSSLDRLRDLLPVDEEDGVPLYFNIEAKKSGVREDRMRATEYAVRLKPHARSV